MGDEEIGVGSFDLPGWRVVVRGDGGTVTHSWTFAGEGAARAKFEMVRLPLRGAVELRGRAAGSSKYRVLETRASEGESHDDGR